jgi:putative Flp pilus-assembly TadE/G-like protein
MRNRLHHVARDERGMSLVFVTVSFMSVLTATTLAIDVGMFMNVRSQAQNAADAGALAGAVALAYNSYTDRSVSGPAVQSAINTGKTNLVGGGAVSILPSDVTFPLDPQGQPNRVAVQVFRTVGRSNPVPTLMGRLFGVDRVDVVAAATAEASAANAETCIKPFTIPDRWNEKQTGAWDPDDTFDLYAAKNKPLANPDEYIPLKPYPDPNTNYTGYNVDRDRGLQIVLKANNQSKVSPSFYNPWALPGRGGASDYREDVANCNTSIIPIGALMTAEPGNMVGPTRQGLDELVDKDPNAVWDESCKCVKNSAFRTSPRVVVIPVYDPVYYETGKQNGRNADLKIANYLGFFIEAMTGNEVTGRITPIGGVFSGSAGPAPIGAFPVVIRLVQ